jgi:acetylornithine deacetylase/succinyl-diaminopimelate desuccinylase-like protein
LIRGGTAYNNVADRCELWLDRRTVPGESQASVLAEIQAIFDDLAAAGPTIRGQVDVARPDWKWQRIRQRGLNPAATLGDNPLTAAVGEAHRQVTGSVPEVAYSDGYLDMDFLVNDLGIPTINYGSGEESLCHTAEGRLRVAQLLAATRVYAKAALALCGGGD